MGRLDGFLRHDRGEVDRKHVQEGGVGAREVEDDGAIIRRLDAGERRRLAAGFILEALDGAEEA